MTAETYSRLSPLNLCSYKPLREAVYEALREAIQQGVLKPGERLMEIPLAEQLGVSRTPIREAIRKLELEGYVAMLPRRGTYVTSVSAKDITEVFEVRLALEELAATLAVDRITEDELDTLRQLVDDIDTHIKQRDVPQILEADMLFHEVLYKASRNEHLAEIIHNLREQILRFRSIAITQPGRLEETWHEHRLLIEAIARKDKKNAREQARRHMQYAVQAVLAELQTPDQNKL